METVKLSNAVWFSKYCRRTDGGIAEDNIGQSLRRVARAVAEVEQQPGAWLGRFESLLDNFQFLPGGRILAGAGSDKRVTLFNCFVAGRLQDSIQGILQGLKETAITMQQGGGVGIDFSPLRPAGSATVRTGSAASGPVSFMHMWDTLCSTLLSTTARRGAMMGTLACDHPDIESFVSAKTTTGALSNFNVSVLISDRFMAAVQNDDPWPLVFPSRIVNNRPDTDAEPRVAREIGARQLWRTIATTAHASAEPGVLFIDTINRNNNLRYCESISATNPCGEIPLPPYGACNLGSINLTAFVKDPFGEHRRLDLDRLRDITSVAVRFLDNIIDASRFPLRQQAEQAQQTRRIGLGITGLADALAMLGLRYSGEDGRKLASSALLNIRDAAYETSAELAREKGAFPCLDTGPYLESPFIQQIPESIRVAIAKNGIRNSHLLSIAPAGTISLLAGNVSSGIEPIFALDATRTIRDADGKLQEHPVRDYAYQLWRQQNDPTQEPPDTFEIAASISASAHLAMQSRLQPCVDNAISKTITLAPEATVNDVETIYADAYASGVKGCTVFRPGATVGQVLRARADTHCCNLDREAD